MSLCVDRGMQIDSSRPTANPERCGGCSLDWWADQLELAIQQLEDAAKRKLQSLMENGTSFRPDLTSGFTQSEHGFSTRSGQSKN